MELDDGNKIPELDDNNKILESDSELKGLYILSAPLLEEKNVVKFGMSECLQNRICAYISYFKTPYYMACYNFDEKHTKIEILAAETGILNVTCQHKTDDFTSEYRRIEYGILHNIICDYLNTNGIVYTIFIKPTWKHFNKNKTILKYEYSNTNLVKYECPTCKYDFKKKCNLEDHLNKKHKCKPPIDIICDSSQKKYVNTNMANHECPTCKREFQRKGNLEDHLNKKNKCKPHIEVLCEIPQTTTKIIHKSVTNDNNCNYCNKSFARKDAAIRHINQYCPVAKQQNKEKHGIFDELSLSESKNKLLLLENKNKLLEEEFKIKTKLKEIENKNIQLEEENKQLKRQLKSTINY